MLKSCALVSRYGIAGVIFALPVSPMAAADFSEVKFQDLSEEQSFEHQYTGGWEHFVGGGVAVFDCNNDGYADAYVAGGENPAKLLMNKAAQQIYFTPIDSPVTDLLGVTGAYPVDIDSDGITDLAVLRAGHNVLLKGLGECRFRLANAEWGFETSDRWTTAFSVTWEHDARGPTMVFGNYVDRKKEDGPFGACDNHEFYRWQNGEFVTPQLLSPGYCTLSILFSDWLHQGRADLRVSNDRHYYLHDGHEQLWKLQKKPMLYTESEGWQSFKIWGMGIAARDITGDGLPDYLLTSMSDQKFQVLKPNTTKPDYTDEAFKRGMIAHRPYFGDEGRPSTAWHAQFGDVNNDGLDDLFIAKGNVDQMPDSALKDPNNLLLQDAEGHFHEVGLSSGVADVSRSRGAALEDFNNDGLLDLMVVNRRAKLRIYQNISKVISNTKANISTDKQIKRNWLAIRLQQAGVNRDAVGAWIQLKVGDKHYHRELTIGGGHAGGSLVPQHFGLSEAEFADVQITWPDQTQSGWQRLIAGVIHKIIKSE